ncbi:hypothetical protein AC1031_008371 [Aphanomyces cochlioides]|nr:hypothetical protein AC1031_008371 [Aphanomyces cochlioides]
MSATSTILSVLLNADTLRRIQGYQHGLYEDLVKDFQSWKSIHAWFDPARQQTMCQLPGDASSRSLDDYFVDDIEDRAFLMHRAIVNGRLDHVQRWIACHGDVSCYAMDCAAAHGQLKIIEWLHSTRSEGCTTDAMDFAALRGHLDVVRFLHKHQKGATFLAMDFAAGQGHLDIVRFLHNNRSEGCTTMAIDAAASNGHLQVVAFLHQHRHEGYTKKAIDGATTHGHDHVVAFLKSIDSR